MGWIVLPSVPAAAEWVNTVTSAEVAAIPSANVGIPIEIVIAVNVDIAATPSAAPAPTTTPECAHRAAHTKRDRSRGVISSVVGWIVDVWVGIDSWAINVDRII